ncbi:hypothetical protein N7539_000847 [Penicillium diatomitis]|uniref:CMP/dCMP-type deaminase domain-containing protein n=1 Tax=Penicillium diatomitis TaxID=2819901 RepID=A0A9X0C2Q9_9EURO|nr:uncharacterized protein N7539_000847 [Penicillium diatomitis]KAJ5495731.1 hypothetical protein N7539_000847 [Penicillium diatomitis]
MPTAPELAYLERCIELAHESLQAGDHPFGSILVNSTGQILKEERNRVCTANDITYHPERVLAVWAQQNMTPEDRAAATVYTSHEHCPMCSAAHAFAGIGRIVFASSSKQLDGWRTELGLPGSPVTALPIELVARGWRWRGRWMSWRGGFSSCIG